ncbi:MAG: hypothetical protein M1814_002648 [Vezdaea aestivalis]|nr:MAG: hypothetical protein M1814_002648 [Vezdaea aestivalis]
MSCARCFSGAIHEGETTGTESTLHGFDVYVATAPSEPPKGIIVLIPDAFGWRFFNMRLLADYYASKTGSTVYIPEFQNGNHMPVQLMHSFDKVVKPGSLWENIKKIIYIPKVIYYFVPYTIKNRYSVVRPRVDSFFKDLRAGTPDLPIGVIGYCWGGRYTILATHKGKDGSPAPVDVAYTAHPSASSIPADIQAITRPISFALGSIDPVLSSKQREVMKTTLEQGPKKKVDIDYEVVVYEGANHGFAARSDFRDAKEKEQADQAGEQGINWLLKGFESWRQP